jgi:hypothetical protein
MARTDRFRRREIRSSVTGPALTNPNSRVAFFDRVARSTVDYLQSVFEEELRDVRIEFCSVPTNIAPDEGPSLYRVSRDDRSILLYRIPIQRAKGLHVDDELHRRMFIEHVIFRAVAEYLGREPWDLLPGQFDHF